MNKVTFIGDVHGKWKQYARIVKSNDYTIQVGDFGIGFSNSYSMEYLIRLWSDGKHGFIRGNHDDPDLCRKHPFWINDGTYEDGIFFVGGAESIDKHLRVEGDSWWADEELSQSSFYKIMDEYEKIKPKIVVTHDCPEEIAIRNFPWYNKTPSRTRQALQSMFDIHQPNLWIHGHWHEHRDTEVKGTRFICLGELQTVEVDLENV